MRKWNKVCHSFSKVRNLIDEESETTEQGIKVMYAMENCCDELTSNDKTEWVFYDDFRDLKAEIHEEVESMDEDDYESCEDTANYYLGELYDLCDTAGVWLEL